MQSVTRTVPDAVSNSVSSTSESGRYQRRVEMTDAGAPTGAMRQKPWLSCPSKRAKHAAESKWGRQSQSMEPSSPTSAAVCRSPITA